MLLFWIIYFLLNNNQIIIIKPNVFKSSRRRKLKLFEGFKTKAVVILTDDDEYKRRFDLSHTDESKDNLMTLINNMKSLKIFIFS